MDPPRRLVQTWRVLYDAAMSEEPPSRVTWEIDPVGDGLTRVRLVHGDLAQSPKTWASVKDGWVWVLDSMKSLIETGEALPALDPSGADARRRRRPTHGTGRRRSRRTTRSGTCSTRRPHAGRRRGARPPGLRRGLPLGPRRRRGPANAARADYMIAKAQLAVGQPALALAAAERCLLGCAWPTSSATSTWPTPTRRGRGRCTRSGRTDEAAVEWQAAHDVPIADPEDKEILDGDLAVRWARRPVDGGAIASPGSSIAT